MVQDDSPGSDGNINGDRVIAGRINDGDLAGAGETVGPFRCVAPVAADRVFPACDREGGIIRNDQLNID